MWKIALVLGAAAVLKDRESVEKYQTSKNPQGFFGTKKTSSDINHTRGHVLTESSLIQSDTANVASKVIGNYKIQKTLGEGGFATVYQGIKKGTGVEELKRELHEAVQKGDFTAVTKLSKQIEDHEEKLKQKVSDALQKGDFQTVTKISKQIEDLKANNNAGSSSSVPESNDSKLYAIKEMKQISPKLLLQAKKEADIMGIVKHKNVIELIETFILDGGFYMVTPVANGGDFHHLIKQQCDRHQYFTITEIANMMGQVIGAVDYLHSVETKDIDGKPQKGIMHRDIKPSNILIHYFPGSSDPVLLLADLGLARTMEHSLALASTHAGTSLYLSPEAHDGRYGLPNDVWALGCVCFECCTFKRPFKSVSQITTMKTTGEVPNICATMGQTANSEHWQMLNTMCMAMLHPDQDCRPLCREMKSWMPELKKKIEESNQLEQPIVVEKAQRTDSKDAVTSLFDFSHFDNSSQWDTIFSEKKPKQNNNHSVVQEKKESDEQELKFMKEIEGKDAAELMATGVISEEASHTYVTHACMTPVDSTGVIPGKASRTYVTHAAAEGYLEAMKKMATIPDIDLTANDGDKRTPLTHAAKSGHLAIIKYLHEEKGLDLKENAGNGTSALTNAAFNGHLHVIKYLHEEKGLDLKTNSGKGSSALIAAADRGQLDVIKYLHEEKGLDLKTNDKQGRSALTNAAAGGHLTVIKYLHEEKKLDLKENAGNGTSALTKAAFWGHLHVIKYLAEKGLDLNAPDGKGNTALFCAEANYKHEVIDFLQSR